MLTVKDLDEAIALYRADPKPTAAMCVKLEACLALRDRMLAEQAPTPPMGGQSFAAAPAVERMTVDSDSEFAAAFNGVADTARALALMDELMDTISITEPALYRRVIRELREL